MYASSVEMIEKTVLKRESSGMVNVRRSLRPGQHFVRRTSEQLFRHWEHLDTGGGASSSISSSSSAMTSNPCQHYETICLQSVYSASCNNIIYMHRYY